MDPLHRAAGPLALASALALIAACSSSGGTASTSSSATSGGGGHGGAGSTSTGDVTATASSSATGSSTSSTGQGGSGGGAPSNRGFPDPWPWVSFYGSAQGVDLAMVASTFRVINVDVDPDADNFTDAEIQTLRASGKNRVISYLNVGSCEDYRSYFGADPPGHKSCMSSGALTSDYQGYPDEKWADLSNAAYRDLIVNYVAPRLAARGVDGFFLDNLEVVEHGPNDSDGPCNAACSQGGLDLVWELRQKFPDKLIVMQNATSDVTRLGKTHGVDYPSLLDGVSHEEVFTMGADPGSLMEMLAWKKMGLMVNGRPFWLAAEDYVGACAPASKPEADAIYAQAKADGLNEYVTDASAMQTGPCFW
jgi:cysteinyl-tRNA synthetase, unknown class